jgi:hypothetical protein
MEKSDRKAEGACNISNEKSLSHQSKLKNRKHCSAHPLVLYAEKPQCIPCCEILSN